MEGEYIDNFIVEIFSSIDLALIYVPQTTSLTYMGIFVAAAGLKNNLMLNTNEDTIRTEYVQIVYNILKRY